MFEITRSRACGLMQLERSSYYYRAHPRDNRALTARLKELAAVRVRYGYRRLTILLLRRSGSDGQSLNFGLWLMNRIGFP